MAIVRFRVSILLLLALLATAVRAQSFRNPYRIPTSTDPTSIAIGDLNGDGIADFVWIEGGFGSVKLHVVLSQPSGGWVPGSDIPFTGTITSLKLCDLVDVNVDRRLDLVCAEADQTSGYIQVFLGNGDGTFQPPIATVVIPSNSGNWANILIYIEGDLNGDGYPDFYFDTVGNYQPSILLSDGKGGFKTPIPAPSGINQEFPVAADVNGDGIPDLLFTNGPEVALGKGDGNFGAITSYAAPSYYDAYCTFHDMDGDGLTLPAQNVSLSKLF